MHRVDPNDFTRIQGKTTSRVVGATPCPQDQRTGKINPQATRFHLEDGSYISVFHVKPVYYETLEGHWRPLSEVTSFHGNHVITLDKWWEVHPRYIAWLDKRCKLIGGRLEIPTFTPAAIRESLQYAMIGHIGLTTTTVYPDPHPETTTVDGAVEIVNSSIGWTATHTATTGDNANDSGAYMQANRQPGILAVAGGSRFDTTRGFWLFDTSSIDDADTVDSATLDFFNIVDSNAVNTAFDYAALVQSSPASNTALVTGDYDQCGAVTTPTEGSDQLQLGSIGINAYKTFTLNATGLTWIDLTGVTKLGVRTGDDMQASDPFAGGTGYNSILPRTADQTGTSEDPKLIIIHSAGAGADNALALCNF